MVPESIVTSNLTRVNRYGMVRKTNRTLHMANMRQLKIVRKTTPRDAQSVDIHLNEIGKIKLITPQREIELAIKIKQGNIRALQELCRANLRFVVSVAKQYQGQGLQLPDLISEGNVGLVKAAKRFDETRGFKFISYAVWWIRQSILQAIAEQARIVRLPLNQLGSINKINKAFAKLEQKFERAPSPAELASVVDLPAETTELYMTKARRHSSIDAPLKDGEEITMLDVLKNDSLSEPEDAINRDDLRLEIIRCMEVLPERDRLILMLWFGIGREYSLTLEEIGEELGVTRECVRQRKERALNHLRRPYTSERLRPYICN